MYSLSIYLSICVSIYLFIYLFSYRMLFIYLFLIIYVSMCLFIYLFIYLFVCLFMVSHFITSHVPSAYVSIVSMSSPALPRHHQISVEINKQSAHTKPKENIWDPWKETTIHQVNSLVCKPKWCHLRLYALKHFCAQACRTTCFQFYIPKASRTGLLASFAAVGCHVFRAFSSCLLVASFSTEAFDVTPLQKEVQKPWALTNERCLLQVWPPRVLMALQLQDLGGQASDARRST